MKHNEERLMREMKEIVEKFRVDDVSLASKFASFIFFFYIF